MNAQERGTLDRFNRAITFVGTNPPVLAQVSPGFAEQVQALKNAVAEINTIAPDRGSGKPRKTANQRATLRDGLRVGQLYPIRRVARVLERTMSGMPHLVNIPGRLANTQALLDAAKATARDVAPYKDQFIAKGLPADFLDRLNTAIAALENASVAHVTSQLAAANAKGQLAKSFQEGRDALTLMDSAIRHACNANPTLGAATLSVWNTIVPARGKINAVASGVVDGTTADLGIGTVQAPQTLQDTPSSMAATSSGPGAASGAGGTATS